MYSVVHNALDKLTTPVVLYSGTQLAHSSRSATTSSGCHLGRPSILQSVEVF